MLSETKCLVRLKNRLVGLEIVGTCLCIQSPYTDKYTHKADVKCWQAWFMCKYKPAFTCCEVTYGLLVHFRTYWGEYILAAKAFTEKRNGAQDTAGARYWKPSNWYEKLKWFAKSAEIWQPYSPGLVHQILLQDRFAIVLQCAPFRNVERARLTRHAHTYIEPGRVYTFSNSWRKDGMLKIVNIISAQIDMTKWRKVVVISW